MDFSWTTFLGRFRAVFGLGIVFRVLSGFFVDKKKIFIKEYLKVKIVKKMGETNQKTKIKRFDADQNEKTFCSDTKWIIG